jgi:hypothetical protein
MVSGTFKSSPSHEGAVRKFAAPAQAMLKQNFRTETILESCISSIPQSRNSPKPGCDGSEFQAPDASELAASGPGQQPSR